MKSRFVILKGFYSGQTLDAVAVDYNDQMLPVDYVVSEAEIRGSWTWFLKLLIHDQGGTNKCDKCSPPISFTFCAFMSQGNFNGGLSESAPDRQVFKIKTDESKYRTQGTNVSLN